MTGGAQKDTPIWHGKAGGVRIWDFRRHDVTPQDGRATTDENEPWLRSRDDQGTSADIASMKPRLEVIRC